MYHVVLITLFLPLLCVKCLFYAENVTDLSRCTMRFSKSDGVYEDFYLISETQVENLDFDFHFLVMAQSDAHIMLTPSKTVKAYVDPVYEIVLGAGRNTYSSLRRTMRGDVKATYRYRDLLSPFEPRAFWIHVSKDGLIEVGRETQDIAFLSWRDPDPLPLVYFSLSTWQGTEAKWYFDCNKNTAKGDGPELNNLQRLMHDYVHKYQPIAIPILWDFEKIDLNLTLKLLFMQLNEKEEKLESSFLMTQKWIDPKLSWLPKDYADIESLKLHYSQIWTPHMQVFSAIDVFDRSGVNTKISVACDGTVTYKTNLHLKTRCNTADLSGWPEDSHECKFPIGFFMDADKINLNLVSNISDLLDVGFKTQWTINRVNHLHFQPKTNDQPNLEITFHLKRISTVYKLIYSTPLIVVALSTLLTFWVSPFGYLKVTLAAFNLLLITVVMVQMALDIPGHPIKVPKILLGYNFGYFCTTLSILLAIVVINISRNNPQYPLPRFLFQILMSRTTQNIFLLTLPKDFMEAPTQHSRTLLASFIDRVSFVTYLVLYGIGLYIYL